MRGRTMYVVPYLMGPPGSPLTKVGIEITDSIYVVLNMRIMSRMGKIALDQLGNSDDFNRGMHSVLDCDPERRFICHFPQDNTIISRRLGLWRERAAGEKMPGAADRQLSWADAGLDGGAHAHPLRGIAGRGEDVRRGRFSQRLRKDELRDAHSAERISKGGRSRPSAMISRG